MPQADLRYSADLEFDAPKLLASVEAVILRHNSGAGACKGRAYPTDEFHHSHVTVSVSLLVKPHRDAAFSTALLDALEQAVSARLPRPCEFSFGLHYSTPFYVTRRLEP